MNSFTLTRIVAAIVLLLPDLCQSEDTLRVVTLNLLNFPANNGANRAASFRTTLSALQPDIVSACELVSAAGADTFLTLALDTTRYARAPFHDGPDSDNMLFYRSDRLRLDSVVTIPTDLRDFTLYTLSSLCGHRTPPITICTGHLKSGSTNADEDRRALEVQALLDSLGGSLAERFLLFCGDFNLYTSDEPAWQALVQDSLFVDPLNAPGDWHDNPDFAAIHTQSTRLNAFGGGASGGLDDRFDFILPSGRFFRGGEWKYADSSYSAFGNDGNHLNRAINDGENAVVSAEVADALYRESDHLPVTLQIVYSPAVTRYRITMAEGWNLISSPIRPFDPDMRVICQGLTNRGTLGFVKDDRGRFYSPMNNFNEIPGWEVAAGYHIFLTGRDTLDIEGEAVAIDTSLGIRAGWQSVAYWPLNEARPEEFFAPLGDTIQIVKDGVGRFYFPSYHFSNLPPLHRGAGYQIQSRAECELRLGR